MTKPTRRKRAESEGAKERIVVSEAALRRAATSYAAVAGLDPTHPRWRRAWQKLRRAAVEMVAEIPEEAGGPEGQPPRAATRPGRTAPP